MTVSAGDETKGLRVAFCGASGTGKTLLANHVSQRYGVPINPVGSRTVAKQMGFEHPYDVDRAGRREEFQARLLKEKCEWELEQPSFVTDRTPLDNLVYTALHSPESITQQVWEQTQTGLQRYTHIFYCPERAFIKIGDDPARMHNPVYHKVCDALLRGFFGSFGVCPFEITSDVKDVRTALVSTLLEPIK